jgi:hypothetical protein
MARPTTGFPASIKRSGSRFRGGKTRTFVLLLLVVIVLLAPVLPSLALAADSEELAVVDLINSYREKNGLSKLAVSGALSKAALGHSTDMANKNFFDHDSLNGASFADRIAATGYKTDTGLGENIAAGTQKGADTFEIWRKSPKHNEIMLGKDFKAVGIGRAYNAKSAYKWYWTADFGGRVDSTVQSSADNSSSAGSSGTSKSTIVDDADVWGHENLEWLADNKGLDGYPDGTLQPGNDITRGELAIMITKTLGIKPGGKAVFKDAVNHWARPYIAALADRGVFVGYVDGKFKPDRPVTRAELTQVITKAAGLHLSKAEKPFADIEGHWAKGTILIAASNDVVTGYADGKFRPDLSCTRAEAATILRRLVE